MLPEWNRKQSIISLVLEACTVLKTCRLSGTESNIHFPRFKACYPSGRESNVYFPCSVTRVEGKKYFTCVDISPWSESPLSPNSSTFWGPSSEVILFTRITLSKTLAKFCQNRHFHPNFHKFTNFAKSVKIVNKISSNLPLSLLPAFLDISRITRARISGVLVRNRRYLKLVN